MTLSNSTASNAEFFKMAYCWASLGSSLTFLYFYLSRSNMHFLKQSLSAMMLKTDGRTVLKIEASFQI
jgi:hypothetical protein